MENQLDKAGQNEIPSETTSADLKPNSEVFVIPRPLFNNILVAAAFFVLGVLSTMMFTTQSAAAHRAEHEQLVNQSVAAALEAQNTTAGNNQGGSALNANTRLQVSVDDDPSEGASDAPITIVEFSDFNCPYCGRFARDTLPLLRQNYGDQIRFVYRDFAILGPTSEDAAVASECANEQSAFWAYHDLLFANQRNFGQEMLVNYAEQVGLNIEQFTECLSNSAMRQEVLADTAEAQRLGATGTPTFFINGRPLVGAQPYEVFVSMIDEELAAANQ